MASLLSKYVIEIFWGIREAFKRTGHGEQFGRQLHPWKPPVSFGSLLPKLVLCSSQQMFCVKVLMNY
ncbi:hypothetical protein KY285_026211 [Solanum tuberosum]|nr:hypothetical protein KY285_026211 [Solanum tuberosum]